ncbi:hypothetical protein KOW79_021987 [Hemibagrus wyckioides]|uniref:MI domain-containing protein n=1 Tax=Hemibagrus wyckioides TaxID=337641 RepID=A0A9D3N4H8_9TELE|nr:hypothetical protein KOW79_021987 [Hemibagrus wyckioides]
MLLILFLGCFSLQFSVDNLHMKHRLKVPTSDNSGATVNFHRLLLNRCQKEFENDKGDDEIFQQKQKELDAATEEEVEKLLNEARRRSLGNIRFIGELFKLKMMKEQIMHVCIVKLLKNHNDESLEVLCRLLSTIGKSLDLEKSKPCMDQYFQQMEQIVKERKTSSRIRFMLQDVLDLRKNNWVPRRGDQGPKTIDQIHKDAELEEQREQIKVQQLLLSKKNSSQERRGKMNQPQEEGWNGVPSRTKKQPIDTPHLTEPDAGRSAMGTLNRFSVLQQSGPSSTLSSSSLDSKCRVPQDQELDRKVSKPALSEEEVEKKTTAIIEEYLHINDLKEAVQCVEELNGASVLFVFIRNAVELVLDGSTVARERIGLLLHELISTRILPPKQYFRGLQEILEVADDMAIDIPYIWQYLAEIITPMLHDGGIPMGLLFREVTKPLLPIGKAAVLLVHILNRLSHNKAGALWIDAGLNWKDFLPGDEDVNKFETQQKVEFTLGRRPERSS